MASSKADNPPMKTKAQKPGKPSPDDVLRRMLSTPPKPHKAAPTPKPVK